MSKPVSGLVTLSILCSKGMLIFASLTMVLNRLEIAKDALLKKDTCALKTTMCGSNDAIPNIAFILGDMVEKGFDTSPSAYRSGYTGQCPHTLLLTASWLPAVNGIPMGNRDKAGDSSIMTASVHLSQHILVLMGYSRSFRVDSPDIL